MMFFLVIPLVILVILWIVYTYNQYINWSRRTDEAWADVDAMLKRRYDLIPNLIEIVKGYAKHEKNVFETVTKERAKALSAQKVSDKATTDAELTHGIKSLFAVAEEYPKLRASENFLKLQEQMTETEDLLEKARRFYNGTVRELNIHISRFPNNIVAGILGFIPREFFEFEEK